MPNKPGQTELNEAARDPTAELRGFRVRPGKSYALNRAEEQFDAPTVRNVYRMMYPEETRKAETHSLGIVKNPREGIRYSGIVKDPFRRQQRPDSTLGGRRIPPRIPPRYGRRRGRL